MYPQFWKHQNCEAKFAIALRELKQHYGVEWTIVTLEGERMMVAPLLNLDKFGNQAGVFRCTMKANFEAAMGEPIDIKVY